MDEAEIVSELTQQGVMNVKRITIKKEQIIKTGTYIMTFNKPQPPERIQIGYVSVQVSIFIPNPLRCYTCQKFGLLSVKEKQSAATVEKKDMNHDAQDCPNAATVQLQQKNVQFG